MIREYVLSYIFRKGPNGTPDRAAIDAALPALEQQLAVLERAVTPTGYLVADRFTFADINLMPSLRSCKRIPRASRPSLLHRSCVPTSHATPSARAFERPRQGRREARCVSADTMTQR
jgi:glutathione S-transferase